MPDFTLFLPPEILAHIFCNVNQLDCIECMIVSRRWYKLIPHHGKDVWKELEISTTSWPRFNNAMLECLGTHVEKLSIVTDQNSNKLLQKLERQGLNIQSLDIQAMFKVYTLALDRAIVFNGIGLFEKTLKELFVDGPCTQYFLLTTLLGLLPALTHLTLKLTDPHGDTPFPDEESINEEIKRNIQAGIDDNNNNEVYNLVFLSLDCAFRRNFHIKHVVKRSPRLKYLLASNSVIFESGELSRIDLVSILELCPSIQYAHWGEYGIKKKVEKQWLSLSRGEKGYRDNANTSDYDKTGANHLRRVDFCSIIEGQHISTLKACLQQSSTLEHLRLSGMSRVDLYHVWNTFTHMNSNLLPLSPPFKSLELVDFRVSRQTPNNRFFKNLFSSFQHVKRLHMGLNVTRFNNVDEQRNGISEMLEAINHQLYHLQSLCLFVNDRIRFGTKMTVRDNLFKTLCEANPMLQVLHLYNVPITNDMLLDVCHHPKLRFLSLTGQYLHKQLTTDGWISFCRKLKERDQNKNGTIELIVLSCSYTTVFNDEVLEELAGVKSLKTLRIQGCKQITDAGINKFASIKSKEYKKIELRYCPNVSKDNPHVVFLRSRV